MRIMVKGALAKLVKGDARLVDKITQVKDPKARYSPLFRRHMWDGVHHYFDHRNQTFPAGLVPRLQSVLKNNVEATYVFQSMRATVEADCLFGITLRDYQIEAIKAVLSKLRGLLVVATAGGKTEIMAGAIMTLVNENIMGPFLVIVPSQDLLAQTAYRLQKRLGMRVTMVGAGQRGYGGQVVVGTYQTLRSGVPGVRAGNRAAKVNYNAKIDRMLQNAKVLFCDEAHHASSDTLYQVCMYCGANIRIGLTGTDKEESPVEARRMEAALGPTIYRLRSETLIDRGILARPTIYFVTDDSIFGKWISNKWKKDSLGRTLRKVGDDRGITRIKEDPRVAYQKDYDQAIVRNPLFNHALAGLVKHLNHEGIPPLLLSPRTEHLWEIASECKKEKVAFRLVEGETNTFRRTASLKAYNEKQNFALLSSPVFDEGVDAPQVGSVILAGGGKSRTKLLQRIGRGLRPKAGMNRLVVIDFSFSNHKSGLQHAMARLQEYQAEGFEVVEVTDLAEFVKRGGFNGKSSKVLRSGD